MKRPVLIALFILLAAVPVAALAVEPPAAPEGSFTIAVIPDTQMYTGKDANGSKSKEETANAVFDSYTKWIVENIERQKIIFVSHTGDIVDLNKKGQWAVARKAMDRLHGEIPYAIAVGNHDMSGKSGDSSLFQEYFPKSRFEQFDWYAGAYDRKDGKPGVSTDNANSCQLYSAEGLDFVHLHLECNAPSDVLAWADEILEKHADRRAIVSTHMTLGPIRKPKTNRGYYDDPKGMMVWSKCHGPRGNSPQMMWTKCFSKHKNLFLVFSGDQSRTQAYRMTLEGRDGNPVHIIMADTREHGLRLYNFRPSENRIVVTTYSPFLGKLCEGTKIVPDPAEHQFELPYDMTR